jgi:hypothetical protein
MVFVFFVFSNNSTKKENLQYYQVVNYFEDNQVTEYELNIGTGNLVFKLKDGTSVKYSVPNVNLFVEDIHDGEVFYYEDDLYLKLSEDVCISGAYNSTEFSAVSLTDGSLAQFLLDEEVGRFATEPELFYDSNTVKYAE